MVEKGLVGVIRLLTLCLVVAVSLFIALLLGRDSKGKTEISVLPFYHKVVSYEDYDKGCMITKTNWILYVMPNSEVIYRKRKCKTILSEK